MLYNVGFFFSMILMYRRFCQLQGVEAKNIHVNAVFQSFTLHFSDFTNVLGTLITIGHVWASDGSPLSLSLGIFLSLCDLAVLYIFNHQLLATPSHAKKTIALNDKFKPFRLSLYAMSSITCILGSKIGSFIVHFTGTILLGAALGMPSPLTLAAAILIATVTTVSGLLFAGIQACDLWEKTSPSSMTERRSTPTQPEETLWLRSIKTQASEIRHHRSGLYFFPRCKPELDPLVAANEYSDNTDNCPNFFVFKK